MRRLQQAGEVHAKRLARFGGLTPMQLMILRVMEGEGRMTASGLSRRVSLSAATLSGMLERLEERGLLLRQRDEEDRRRQWLSVSEAGRALLVAAPPLLPPALRSALAALPEWEKHSLTAALLPGFQIDGFWAALFGAIVIGVVCWLGDMVLGQAESQR